MTWLVIAGVLLATGVRQPAVVRSTPRPSRLALQVGAGVACAGLVTALVALPAAALVAVVVVPLAVLGAGRLHDRPAPPAAPADAALALALTAAALRAGMPTVAAIGLAAPAAADPGPLLRVAGLLRLGASSEQAWSTLASDAGWSSIAVLASRSGHSGIKLADSCERSATELLAQQRAAALARAHRVSVLAVGPLGACFLPAFLCLGILPVVVAVAAGVGELR